MAKGLCSRSAMIKDNSNRYDDISLLIFKELQEQMHEVVLKSCVARQDSEERADLVARLAGIETKIKNKHVSDIHTLYLHSHIKINATTLTKHHSNWKYPDLMVQML